MESLPGREGKKSMMGSENSYANTRGCGSEYSKRTHGEDGQVDGVLSMSPWDMSTPEPLGAG